MSLLRVLSAAALGLAVAMGPSGVAAQDSVDALLKTIKLPPGFKINVFAKIPRARSMVVGKPLGTVFVGSRHGTVHLVQDRNRDGIAEEILEKTNSLNVPNGVAYLDSILYVGEQTRIVKWVVPAEFDSSLPLDPLLQPVFEGLPDEFLHGWRYIGFGPDKKLYVSVGSPCNVCEVSGHEGKILRMDRDGKNVETVASGVRNSVGFDWNPITKELWFTDNGSDDLGDDIPADELNRVTKIGQHYGFPYFGGGSTRTPDTKGKTPPADNVKPAIEFQAHSANLGIHFYTGDMFPAQYKNDAFVAQHGSWNRSEPVGYQIMRIKFDDKGNAVGKEVFASGWLENGNAWGRPVDIKTNSDGSLLVSDDFLGVIYRISYEG